MYHRHADNAHNSITIRPAQDADADALRRLAQRDSATPPAGEVLVAFVGDEMRAAVEIATGRRLADPFHPTAELLRLLGTRAAQMRRSPPPSPRSPIQRLLRRRRTRPALSPQPAGTLRAFE